MSVHAVPPLDLPPGPGVFTQDQIRCLEEDAIFLPQPSHTSGKRKVSAAFSARSVSSTSSSSSSSSVSIETRGFEPNVVQTSDIPMSEESVEVLEFIGFVPNAARLVYNRYLNRPDPDGNPDDLMAYVSGHISSLKLPQYDNISRREALRQIGLNLQIQDAITDPRFSHIFGTQTLHYWAKDTFETNYAALLSRQRLLKSHANRRLKHKKKHKRLREEASLAGGPSQQPAVTATINMTPRDFQFPEAHVAMGADAEILENHLVLYKGKAFQDLEGGEIIRSDGSVNLYALTTHAGGDFNWGAIAHYWTPQRETAEEYRKWAARRSPNAETCIIQIQIPQSFIQSLRIQDPWYSPNWKEYVWTCRKKERPDQKFDCLWRPGQVDVVKGHICSTVSRQITRIPRESVQTHLSEDNVMKLPSGKKACQWMFLENDTIIDLLAREIRGKMHFVIVEATACAPTATA